MDELLKKGVNKNLQVALTIENVSPVTRLLEKRKQMLQVQESLDAQKEEYQRKEELFKRREENLRKKDLELQEALVLFNKFLKENEHKRRRADHRAAEEIKKRHQTENNIAKEKLKLSKKKKELDRKIKEVARNEKYLLFLQQVYDENENHFDEPNSIITRYNTLAKANQDLKQKQQELTDQASALRTEFANYRKDIYNEMLGLNNEIAKRSKDLEIEINNTSASQDNLELSERAEESMKAQTTQIMMAVDNLYMRCKKGTCHAVVNDRNPHGPEIKKSRKGLIKHSLQKYNDKELVRAKLDPTWKKMEDTNRKLDVICHYLVDFKDMVNSIKKLVSAKGGGRDRNNRMDPGQYRAVFQHHESG